MALDASAEERDTRGFISITTMRPSRGIDRELHVGATSLDTDFAQDRDTALRSNWYSLSVKVCAGATVIESPVWIPIGSRFSIEQTMMQLSTRSRTTSISNSFQPISDSSISSSLVGDRSSPRWQMATNSSML